MEDFKNHHFQPGWITEFVPTVTSDEPVLCRGWHAATHQQWFIGVYVHEMIDGRWVVQHDGTEPEFVTAWTPIPGYPYSQSFKEWLAEKGYPIYPHVATSSDGMAIEIKTPGYAVVNFIPRPEHEDVRRRMDIDRASALAERRALREAK